MLMCLTPITITESQRRRSTLDQRLRRRSLTARRLELSGAAVAARKSGC
jgi:hypothetical protein